MGTNAVGLSSNNMAVLKDMAKMAYGSRFFEGKNGGNGYLGAILDSEGNPRIVKMLTHGDERKGIGKTAAEMTAFLKNTNNCILQFYSNNIKNLLTKLAERAGVTDTFTAMLNGEGGKPLLSRKFVARAVEMIATTGKKAEGNTETFDWNEIGKNRAKTEDVTSGKAIHDSATNLHASIDKVFDDDRTMFTVNDHDLVNDPFATKEASEGRLMLFEAGKLDRDWKSAMLSTLNFANNILLPISYHNSTPFSSILIQAAIENFNKPDGGWNSAPDCKIFFDILKKELQKEIGKPENPWPSSAGQKLQVLKRASMKAAVCQFAYNAASQMIKDKCDHLDVNKDSIYKKLYDKFMGLDGNNDHFEELITYKALNQDLESTKLVNILFDKEMCAMSTYDQATLKNNPDIDPRQATAHDVNGDSTDETIWGNFQSTFENKENCRVGMVDILNRLLSFNTQFFAIEDDNRKKAIFELTSDYASTLKSYEFKFSSVTREQV